MASSPNTPATQPADASAGRPVVVVGVDGSPASHQALLFAAHEAQLRSAVLHIVGAHDLGASAYAYGGGDLGSVEEAMRQAAEELVKAAADTVATDLPGPPVHVRTEVVQGRPSHVLLHASSSAALLVVGARGAGALTRLMMGSTSGEVVHAAHVPVAVVPSAVVPSAAVPSA